MIKLSTLLIAACCLFSASRAQTTDVPAPKSPLHKGNIAVGSGLALASLEWNDRWSYYGQRQFRYDIRMMPSAGIFVTDNLLLSADLNAGAAKDYSYNGRYVYMLKGQSLGIGLGARYYFGKALTPKGELKKLRPFANGGIGYLHRWEQYRNIETAESGRYSLDDMVFNGGLGFSYLLSPQTALDAGLSYYRALSDYGQVRLQLGLQVFLTRK